MSAIGLFPTFRICPRGLALPWNPAKTWPERFTTRPCVEDASATRRNSRHSLERAALSQRADAVDGPAPRGQSGRTLETQEKPLAAREGRMSINSGRSQPLRADRACLHATTPNGVRSEEHTSELQSLMRI